MALHIHENKRRREQEKLLNETFEAVRVEYKGVNVPAFKNKEGIIGKVCPVSHEFKPIKEFGIRRNGEFWYLTSRTLKASSENTRVYRNKRYDKHIWSGLKHRSKREGTEFDLSVRHISIPENCPILGIKLDASYGPRTENRVTVDRIDNDIGYVQDNIIICSWRANRLKSDATLEEIEKIYNFYKPYIEKSKKESNNESLHLSQNYPSTG